MVLDSKLKIVERGMCTQWLVEERGAREMVLCVNTTAGLGVLKDAVCLVFLSSRQPSPSSMQIC